MLIGNGGLNIHDNFGPALLLPRKFLKALELCLNLWCLLGNTWKVSLDFLLMSV